MRTKLSTVALISGLALLSAVAGCKKGGQQKAGAEAGTGASPVNGLVLANLDGTTSTLDQYKGKVVLVNFWATWCQPCQIEIPWLIEFNEKYGPKGLVILGVAMDDEGKKVVEPFVKDRRFTVGGQSEAMNYPIVLGDDKTADKFGGLIGLPTSMLYSRDGKKVKTIVGLINYDDLSKALQSQL